MLVQRDLGLYTPPHRALATYRREVAAELSRCPCSATQQRVLLAVNEIIANVLRHAAPAAADIHIDFIDHADRVYCVVRDDGGAFTAFQPLWRQAAARCKGDMFSQDSLGLKLINRLWPEAFYIPRSDAFPYNSFILPLTEKGGSPLPRYFLSKSKKNWVHALVPLVQQERV